MSNLTAILLILVTFALSSISLSFFLARGYERSDKIVTGVVNGVALPLKHRWLILVHDYLGLLSGGVFMLGVLAVGFFNAGAAASDHNVRGLAYLCAAMAGFGAVFHIILGASWIVHFVSVLRQAEQG